VQRDLLSDPNLEVKPSEALGLLHQKLRSTQIFKDSRILHWYLDKHAATFTTQGNLVPSTEGQTATWWLHARLTLAPGEGQPLALEKSIVPERGLFVLLAWEAQS
jgi:hypothetical protein